MRKNNTAYKLAKRAAEKEANKESNKKQKKRNVKKMATTVEEKALKKKNQKAPKKRNLASTKSQLVKKCSKSSHTTAIKLVNQMEKQRRQAENRLATSSNDNTGQPIEANSAFRFDDNDFDYGYDYAESSSNQPRNLATAFRPKKQTRKRKDFWTKESDNLKKWYRESYEIHGHADPTLKTPKQLKESYKCNCSDKKTMEIYCYMLHNHHKIKVDYCTDHPILKQLILMQMLPSSTIQPKDAIHFAVFEKLMSLKLYGSLSNFAFYLGHLTYIIKAQGLPASHSTRSIERCIGQMKRRITARTNVDVNAGNVIDRLALMRCITTSVSGDDESGEDNDADDNNLDVQISLNRRLLT